MYGGYAYGARLRRCAGLWVCKYMHGSMGVRVHGFVGLREEETRERREITTTDKNIAEHPKDISHAATDRNKSHTLHMRHLRVGLLFHVSGSICDLLTASAHCSILEVGNGPCCHHRAGCLFITRRNIVDRCQTRTRYAAWLTTGNQKKRRTVRYCCSYDPTQNRKVN